MGDHNLIDSNGNVDPRHMQQNGHWERTWLLSVTSQDEGTQETPEQNSMNVELEIMSPSTLRQRHSEKAVWTAFSMKIRYIFIGGIVNFIIEYIA